LVFITATGKQAGALNRAAFTGLGLRGLPVKQDVIKATTAMDDSEGPAHKLTKLGDLPAIDMSMDTEAHDAVGDLEGDDDDDEANQMEAELRKKAQADKASNAMEVDEDDDVDPLDAFMSGVKDEVHKVDEQDMKRTGVAAGRSRIRLDDPNEPGPEEGDETVGPDEIDTTELNPEDILALAARKAKKKEITLIDHAKVSYEPFRREFYVAPPEIAAMTDDDAELVRLELDGIKIRGVDCPRPVTKWSHFGMPATW
jgi:ATP-dependent RNA helicase DDX46/PRP5